MVIYEQNGDFTRAYSNAGFYIHGGNPEADYTEAYDPTSLGRTYTETTTPIEDDEATLKEKAAGYDILMGGEANE